MREHTPTAPLLDLRGVGRDFPAGEGTLTVLQDINLQIHAGEMLAIVGQSGSGKSTLMNLIGCLDTPSSGSYRLKGREIARMEEDPARAAEVGAAVQVAGRDGHFDILIDGDRIAKIGKNLPTTGATVIEVPTGFLVTPGLIDMHVHLREPGQEHKETVATGTLSAVAPRFSSRLWLAWLAALPDAPSSIRTTPS